MSIFTRLNALIIVGILIIMATVFLLRGQISVQDAMTVEYRQIAIKENIANRLQANLFKKRINMLLYVTSGADKFIDRVEDVDPIIARLMADLRAQSVTDETTLLQIEEGMEAYTKAQEFYLTQLETINHHATLAAKVIGDTPPHDEADQKTHELILSELLALAANPQSYDFIDGLVESIKRQMLEHEHEHEHEHEQLTQSLTMLTRSVEQANEAAGALRLTAGPLSKIIEDVKLGLKQQQDTLGPALREKIAATERVFHSKPRRCCRRSQSVGSGCAFDVA